MFDIKKCNDIAGFGTGDIFFLAFHAYPYYNLLCIKVCGKEF